MNKITTSVNGGRMPVFMDYHYDSDTHFSFQDKEAIENFYLTDIFHIGNYYYSIGDGFVFLGFSLLLIHSVILLVQGIIIYKKEVEK